MNVGGQALIDGIMMRSPSKYSFAVRNPQGKIILKTKKTESLTNKKPYSFPFIRGIISMWEMLKIGFEGLNFSAEISDEDEEELNPIISFLVIIGSIILVLALFKLVPLFLVDLMSIENYFLYNLTDGIIKIIIFLGYLFLISLSKEVRKTFQYHGAEHKTIHALENNEKLTVKNIKKYSTLHPRCGTSFIAWVIMVSIILYMLIPPTSSFLLKLGFRFLLLIPIISVSYEFLKTTSKSKFLTRILARPGLLLQKITTKEPNDEQIKVAIKALKAVL